MQVYTGSDASNTSSNWTDIGGGTILADADGNTNIEIGATTADEIDVDIAGTKMATLDGAGTSIEAGAVGVRTRRTISATQAIAKERKNIGLFGTVTFTGTVTVAGDGCSMSKIKVNEISKHDASEITVNDTVKVDTIAEKTSGAGVTVDGLTIKDTGFDEPVSLKACLLQLKLMLCLVWKKAK